jgi:hypothetical protein
MKKIDLFAFLKQTMNGHLEMRRQHEVKLQALAVAKEIIEIRKQTEKMLKDGTRTEIVFRSIIQPDYSNFANA